MTFHKVAMKKQMRRKYFTYTSAWRKYQGIINIYGNEVINIAIYWSKLSIIAIKNHCLNISEGPFGNVEDIWNVRQRVRKLQRESE